jgi:D-glycero-D-manno-heptose 1,7-bisphosphate phosphatase
MMKKFEEEGIKIEEVAYCPHHPDEGCECRKPKPGMIERLAKKYDIDLTRSWMIGDKKSDIEAARRAGVGKRILLENRRLIDVVDVIQ